MSTEQQLQLLLDEREIRNLTLSAWAAIDGKDWEGYANVFTEDGEFEIMGQRRKGREEIVAGPARDLTKFDGLQHIVTNQIVAVDGDRAEGQWYTIAVHVPDGSDPASHADVGLRYRFTARREAEGWLFTEVVLDILWTSGMSFGIEEHSADA
jgi:uncharacterized protein (TIGR02246 family)